MLELVVFAVQLLSGSWRNKAELKALLKGTQQQRLGADSPVRRCVASLLGPLVIVYIIHLYLRRPPTHPPRRVRLSEAQGKHIPDNRSLPGEMELSPSG